ncbi:MAG: hypothetical protein ACI89X_002279 [Planctomycetota bacterium]|jgi:hypothetical protein
MSAACPVARPNLTKMLRVTHTPAVIAVLLALSLPSAATAQDESGYAVALARYNECLSRLPFQYHTEGRETLGKTREIAALDQLSKDYAKSKEYSAYSRFTIAEIIARSFKSDEWVAPITKLRAKNDDLIDTWLWVRTLTNEIDQTDDNVAVALARESKKPHLRAAAIAALGASKDGNMASAILANCIDFPRKEADRMLVLGAMTGALYHKKQRVNDEEYRKALKAYISLLSKDVKLKHTAKVQMARHLQDILNGPAKFINPEPWLELLDRGDVKKKAKGRTSSQSKFFGIETEGERFCYVLDMSDSMLKEIVPSARPPRGPITGPKKKKKKKKSMVLDESDLPWHSIVTRWDLAREQLRISLSRLSSDKYFSIVWFGTEAGTLNSTDGMVKASKGNIKKAMAELDSIRSHTDKNGKEALRGKTSLHYGLRIAFSLGKRGANDEPVYVGAKPMTEGCDTMFLLSDGAPNWDGFDILDKNYGEGQTYKDIEAGIKAPAVPNVVYHGPYAGFPKTTGSGHPDRIDCWLIRDVERMNAFRRIRVHCVGLGEANEILLKNLAAIGNGEVFIVGKKK